MTKPETLPADAQVSRCRQRRSYGRKTRFHHPLSGAPPGNKTGLGKVSTYAFGRDSSVE